MAFDVKRLYGRDRRDAAVENKRRYRQLLAEENEAEANLHKRKCLINHYRLEQGQIIDYMVDYNDDKFKLGSGGFQEEMAENYGQERDAMRAYARLDPEQNAALCASCSAPCEAACSFDIPIKERLVATHRLLKWS